MQQNPTASQQDRPVRRVSAHRAKPAKNARNSRNSRTAKAAGAAGSARLDSTARADDTRSGTVLYALPYLLVLAAVLAGLLMAFGGSRYAGRGMGLAGCALLAAGLARMVLPPRYAGLLASRHKAIDVLAFAVLGGGVLGFALWLP